DRHQAAGRTVTPEVVFAPWVAATIVALFILIAISAGLVFHVTTVALPKIVDERLGLSVSLMQVGGIATLILMCGGLALCPADLRAGGRSLPAASSVCRSSRAAVHRCRLERLCERADPGGGACG